MLQIPTDRSNSIDATKSDQTGGCEEMKGIRRSTRSHDQQALPNAPLVIKSQKVSLISHEQTVPIKSLFVQNKFNVFARCVY